MKPHTNVGSLTGHLAMTAAIVVIVAIATIIEVQLSLSRIDPNDSATWPNMAPEIRYYFIPVLALLLSIACALINFFLQLLDHRRLQYARQWVLLGLAFCLVLLGFPLTGMGVSPSAAFAISLVIALSAVLEVRSRYGVPVDQAAV
jgi:hypothetical protein